MDSVSNRGRQAFRLKGMMPALTLLCLLTEDLDAIERQLVDHLSQMPQFFLHAPIIVDLEGLGDTRIDLSRLGELLRRHHLVPVAVRNPSDAQQKAAIQAGWGVLQSSLGPSRGVASPRHAVEDQAPSRQPKAPLATAEPAQRALSGLTVRTPVRSGQVVYAIGGDLVVLAPVSSGAELIADGSIHVYAPLRGRALAGVHDNPDASIFCMSLEAEFLSIAGRYIMSEDIPKDQWGKPARTHLERDEVVITRI